MRLVPDWKEAYTWFSVHGAVILTVLSTVYAYVGAFQGILPPTAFSWLTAALGVGIIAARLVQQSPPK